MKNIFQENFFNLINKNGSTEALNDGKESYTYEEFYNITKKVSAWLSANLEDNSKICVLLPYSAHQVVTMYSIFLSGNVYVPLEKGMSSKRLEYILDNSECKLIVSSKELIEILPQEALNNRAFVNIDELINESSKVSSLSLKDFSSSNVAYLIYTSGSTGKPKGVQITYSNLLNLINSTNDYFGYMKKEKTVLMNALCFDLSIWETIIAFSTSSTLFLINDDIRLDQNKLIDFIKNKKVSYLVITPSYCGSLLSTAELFSIDLEGYLKMLFLGAEKLTTKLVERVYHHFGNSIKVYNGYGPTEVTVCSFIKEINFKELDLFKRIGNVPIGKEFQGLTTSIKDQNGNDSTKGTMFLKGDAVSKLGYLGLPEQTKRVFSYDTGEIEYDTGDIVEKIGDDFYFIERKDTQVKIHGYRVELDEIKNTLLNHELINDCIVLFNDSEIISEQILIAFFISKNNQNLESSNLRTWSERYLNNYMIPNIFISIDEIPRNINGKADEKYLLELYNRDYRSKANLMINKKGDRKSLESIFIDILGQSDLDFSKSFFELGGHSLAAFQLQDQIKKQYSKHLSIQNIFEASSLNDLVWNISNVK